MSLTWIYHSKEEPKIVEQEEADALYKQGWKDSPAKCEGFLDKFKEVDRENPAQMQQLGETVEAITKAANGALNLKTAKKVDLEAYAKENYGVELDRRLHISKLRKQVKDLIG